MRQILLGNFKSGLNELKKKVNLDTSQDETSNDSGDASDDENLILKKIEKEKKGDFEMVDSDQSSKSSSDNDD
jgi:hypothetical protein